MSKYATAGELRTPVYFKRIERTINANGFPIETEVNVFGEEIPIMCKWVNVYGSEAWTASQLQLREPATITTRYSPLLDDVTLLAYLGADTAPYEVVSVNNVEQRNVWLEIKVQRKVGAR